MQGNELFILALMCKCIMAVAQSSNLLI